MGLFSQYAGSKAVALDSGIGVARSPVDRGAGRRLWREIFGTEKESGGKGPGERQEPVPSGGWGRSSIAGQAATKRLLEAFRSMAPGGWSDDRWEQTKHFEGIQYVCVHRTNEQMLQAEFQVFHKMGPGPDDKEEVKPGDPAYQLIDLLEKPNRDDTFGELMARWNQQMDLTGMALTWMVPNMLGVPKELYSVPTAIAIPQPTVNPDYPDGFYRIQPIYPYGPFSSYPTPASAVGAPIPAQWIIKMLYPHPLLRYDGYSPLTALRLHIDEITMMDRSRHYSMRRSINPSAVMNFDAIEGLQPLPEEEIERIHAEWESEYQGPESHGKLIVGTPGSHLEPWGVRPVDMDYQHGWDQLVAFVMAGFGITKPAAGMVEDASYATLFATLKQFHLLTLVPKCQRIAQKLTRHLAPFFGDHLIVEVRPQRIDDHDVMFSKIDRGMAARCITKNQVLRMLDLPVTDQPWGDEMAGTEPMMGMIPGQEGQPMDQGNTTLVDRFAMGEEARYGAKPDEKLAQDEEPVPGKLARRGIGPRKSLPPPTLLQSLPGWLYYYSQAGKSP